MCKNGHKFQMDNYRFCPICGEQLSQMDGMPFPESAGTITCPYCDCENAADATICTKCGSNLKEKVCANCRNTWNEGDRYCRYCGAPLEHPDYKIKEFYCIYGPMPVKRKHTCKQCNYSWITRLMIDNEEYCPRCGAKVRIKEIERPDMQDDSGAEKGRFFRNICKKKESNDR